MFFDLVSEMLAEDAQRRRQRHRMALANEQASHRRHQLVIMRDGGRVPLSDEAACLLAAIALDHHDRRVRMLADYAARGVPTGIHHTCIDRQDLVLYQLHSLIVWLRRDDDDANQWLVLLREAVRITRTIHDRARSAS